jgi:hypothetical protein
VVLRGERVLLSRKRMTARALVEQILLETV